MPNEKLFDEIKSIFILKDMAHQTERIEVFAEQIDREFGHIGEDVILKGIAAVKLSQVPRPNIDDFRKAISSLAPRKPVVDSNECDFCSGGIVSMVNSKTQNTLAFACICRLGAKVHGARNYPQWNGRAKQSLIEAQDDFKGDYAPWFLVENVPHYRDIFKKK